MRSVRSIAALVSSLVLACPLAAASQDAGASGQASSAQAGSIEATPPKAEPGIRDLAPLVVSGKQPGPGLWKVVAGDGHVLWVLGYVRPLPTGMDWQSDEVEAIIAQAGQVLDAPSLQVGADVGFLGGLTLLPAALGMRRSPDGAELEDLLPDTAYRRWQGQKEKYLGWEWGIERWRPGFAADKLYEAALEHHGLGGGTIDPVVVAATRRAGLDITPVSFSMQIEEPRALMKAFSRIELDDVACMERTLDRLEYGIGALVDRANAWATGDLDALRRLRGERVSCLEEALRSDFARQHGFAGIERKIRSLWLDTAERALADHAVSFALLPMDEVLAADGYLADLAGRGYHIEPPRDVGIAAPLPAGGRSPPALTAPVGNVSS
jgi:hypothetical protein